MLSFAALLAFSVAIRVADPTGWLGSDDSSYFLAAEHIRSGQVMQRAHHHFGRAAFVVPVAISTALFGDNPTAVALPSMVASVLCLALVVLLGRLIWGWWEGLFAATAVSVLPYFRVLSTAGLPDVHACMWMVGAIMLAVWASRRPGPRAIALGLLCGMSCGLMASAKDLAASAAIGVIAVVGSAQGITRKHRASTLAAIMLGGILFSLFEGLFFLWAADDFLFRVHGIRNTQSLAWAFPPDRYLEAMTFAELAWNRFAMLFDPAKSGWGYLAIAFWPASITLLLFGLRGRAVAIWAIGAYLIVALVPVSLRNGPQPFPIFDGRNLLFACIPFALCLARVVSGVARLIPAPVWARGFKAVSLPAVVALASTNAGDLSAFRHRSTASVGRAIGQIIAVADWDRERPILMSPSLYLRYGLLFPPELKPRLRVAVDELAPRWWREASVDILPHVASAAEFTDAYVIATPRQLQGETESWDYEVGLPKDPLRLWQSAFPLVTIYRFPDATMGPGFDDVAGAAPILRLLKTPTLDANVAMADSLSLPPLVVR